MRSYGQSGKEKKKISRYEAARGRGSCSQNGRGEGGEEEEEAISTPPIALSWREDSSRITGAPPISCRCRERIVYVSAD